MLRAELELFGDADTIAADVVNQVPLRRFATAEEISAGVYYLAVGRPIRHRHHSRARQEGPPPCKR